MKKWKCTTNVLSKDLKKGKITYEIVSLNLVYKLVMKFRHYFFE